jgi:hypothetical protein
MRASGFPSQNDYMPVSSHRNVSAAKVMLQLGGEITNKIRGGKVICPSIIAAQKVWGKGRKYVGYQKSDPLIQTTGDERPPFSLDLNLNLQCQRGSRRLRGPPPTANRPLSVLYMHAVWRLRRICLECEIEEGGCLCWSGYSALG